MPIKGITEVKRLPRLGKIHLGVKVKNPKGIEYPRATDYFVCPPEVLEVYGSQPRQLDILIPVEDDEMWCNQYYRQYSRTRGLVCKGDGETCRRMLDKDTGAVANRDSREVVWAMQPCQGRECPDYQAKNCQEVMNLQFMLPRVPGLGIWQIDTGSINSIRKINDSATMVRAICGRVSWIPLTLSLEPTTVVNPDDGKKKTVHCLTIRHGASLVELLNASQKPKVELLIAAPSDEEAPMDEAAEDGGKIIEPAEVVAEVEELWLEDKAEEPPPIIDMEWLEEKLTILKTRIPQAFGDANLISYMRKAYQVDGETVRELAGKLDKPKATHFCRKIEEALDKSMRNRVATGWQA